MVGRDPGRSAGRDDRRDRSLLRATSSAADTRPTLSRIEGTVRFDVVDGDRVDHWLVNIDRGNLAVSRADGPADCVVSGEQGALRPTGNGSDEPDGCGPAGRDLAVDGDLDLLLAVQRVFPGPQPVPVDALERE